jgi:putative ABC transport system permease protein
MTMLREQLAMAIDSLRANTFRSLLTMLGIIIGTGTLVAVLSLGNAVQGQVFEQFIDLGTRRIAVTAGDPSARGARDVPGYGLLSLDDAAVVRDLVERRPDLFRTTTVEVIVPLDIRAGGVGLRDAVVGTGPEYARIQSIRVAAGRFLTDGDETRRAPVAVLGGLIARDLYGADPAAQAAALGTTVQINGQAVEVVGILRAAGGPFSADRRVLVPVSTLRLRLNSELDVPGRGLRVSSILVGLVSEQLTDDAAAQIRTALRAVRSVPPGAIDDFEMSLPTEALGVLRGINGAITGFVALVAGISLLVGGIGIMNIMLVAVTERTREIGVRKALGATDRDILGQFVLEATAVSLIGGAIGVSGAIGLVLLVGTLSGIAAPIAWGAVIIALVFAAFVGIGFGSYPARRAALLLPVEALRYE